MKYAMMTYTLSRQEPGGKPDMEKVCGLARRLGLDAMDQVTLYGYQPADIRRIADDHGIRIVCYTFDADINFPDADARRPGLEEIRRGLETANVLGAPLIMLPLGGKAPFTRDESRRNVIKGLREAVELGKEARVKVSVEHFSVATAPFIVSSDVNEALAAVGDLYVTFDDGNVLMGGEDPRDGFLKSKARIVHTHFKDWIFAPQGRDGRIGLDGRTYLPALIGEGLVDYPALLKTMRDAGYDGYINIEYEGNDYPADAAVGKALDYLRRVEKSSGV